MKKLTLLSLLVFIAYASTAQIINIPNDFPTIQQGINAAENGDTVLVQPGTYFENINFNGKKIALGSLYLTTMDTSYVSTTIIDGNEKGQVVIFENGEDSTTLLSGFTLTRGRSSSGGGIYCYNSNPVIDNIVITNCTTVSYWHGHGGGIYIYNGNPTINNITISGCTANTGGGISLENSNSTIINATIKGNTADGGDGSVGGGIFVNYYSSPVFENIQLSENKSDLGGGIYCFLNSVGVFRNMIIENNIAQDGGGMYIGSDSLLILENIMVRNNTASENGGGIYLSRGTALFDSLNKSNIYHNWAIIGKDIFRGNSQQQFNLVLDTFSVLYPTEYYIESLNNVTIDIEKGLIEQVDADLYISPDGNNENSGLTENEPLKNLDFAFSIIRADSVNHHTFNLDDGTYSASVTGELFPVNVIDFVNLKGTSDSTVILDAENLSRVMSISSNDSSVISNLTLTGGKGSLGGGLYCSNSRPYIHNIRVEENLATGGWYDDGRGGGMYFESSNPILQHIMVLNNSASAGAGIYFKHSTAKLDNVIISDNTSSGGDYYNSGGGVSAYQSDIVLTNSKIKNNACSWNYYDYDNISSGGGLSFNKCNINLNNVLVTKNFAYSGGGIYIYGKTSGKFEDVTIISNDATMGGAIYWDNDTTFVFDETNRCNIYGNRALHGNDLFAGKAMHVVVDTFSVLSPTEYFADPHENFTFDILNGKIEQVNADLYVSPDGNNNNDGLSEDNPLQTIHWAISKMQVDWYNTHDIHLMPGIYNVSETNEFFPINLPDFISLVGAGDITTIIDAEYKSEVILIDNNNYNKISDLTITGGDTLYDDNSLKGSAINCVNSSPELYNLTLTGNGGFTTLMISDYSDPKLTNVNVVNNLTSGVYCSDYSKPHIDSTLIAENQYSRQYWGGELQSAGINFVNQSDAYLNTVNILNNIANGNSTGGGFYCDNSSPRLYNVVVSGNQGRNGGGLYFENGSAPLLENVVINNNDGYWGKGGGMYVYDSNPEFSDVKITENSANTGGGIHYEGDCNPYVHDTIEVSNNHAGSGGGVYVSGENMSLENMMIFENEATSRGGGIDIYGGIHFLSNLIIKNNKAETGGGIQFHDYRVFFDSYERCNIFMNKATYGDDLYADNLVVPINIIADTFTVLYPNDNHAYQSENFTFNILYGLVEQVDADLYLSPDGDNKNSGLTPEDPLKNLDYALAKILAREDNPHTIHLMEGIYSPSLTGEDFPITLIDYINLVGTSRDNVILDTEGESYVNTIRLDNNTSNTISDLTVKGSAGYNGAIHCINSNITLERLNVINNSEGIRFAGSTPVIRDVLIANNSGNGMEFYSVDEGIVEDCIIEYNSTWAGIDINNSSLLIKNTSVLNNEGRGIYFSDSEITLEDIEVAENTGRGISCKYSTMELSNAFIHNNTDGGIFTTYSDAVLNNVTFENNSADKGGGMYVHVSNMEADSIYINNNTSRLGGGIYDYHSELKLTNSIITENEASEEGGGVYGAKATTNIANTLIANNTAFRGGGVYSILYNDMSLINSTIVSNTADNGGGLAGWYYAHPKITNSILWNNSEPNIFFDGRVESYLDISYSDIQGGQEAIVTNDAAVVNWLEGNLDEDPLFIDTGEFDFALSDESPCINAGNPDTLGLNLPEIDLLGNPRIWNNRIDIGVIEWNSLGIFNQDGSESEYMLSCSPNPFATSTIVEYELEKSGYVQLSIYNHMGDLVEVLVQKHQPQGKHQVNWESLNLPAGIYHCILKTESKTGSFKLIKL